MGTEAGAGSSRKKARKNIKKTHTTRSEKHTT